MDYKYKKNQIFRKKLKVPKHILFSVYHQHLSFSDYIKYELADKIPITCLKESDRQIVEKFGLEKAKTLDWNLLNEEFYQCMDDSIINLKELLMSLDPSIKDLNIEFYELVKDQISPKDYTPKMKELYQDRIFETSEEDDFEYEKSKFNKGQISLIELINNWDLYKDKDSNFCLKNDKKNKFKINNDQLKIFMNEFSNISKLILDTTNIYEFIYRITSSKSESEKHQYIKQITDNIIEKLIIKERNQNNVNLSNKAYKELFKYSSMQDYLKNINSYSYNNILDRFFHELENLPQDYIFDIHIPFDVLKNGDGLYFVANYGLKNIVDFDNECGHFFTKNNCQMIKSFYEMYIKYNINAKNKKSYTKNEFYEKIKEMIVYGPTNANAKAPDYGDITGEFRVRNPQLFISEQAPTTLKSAFYTKNITPHLLQKHPEYIPYLNGKDLSACFKKIAITVEDSKSETKNFYDFIDGKADFNKKMNFITEYSDVFDIFFDSNSKIYNLKFSKEDNISEIQRKINDNFKRIIIEKGIAYPKIIPQNLRTNYPSLFLSPDAPKELQEAFYNRTINLNLILANPTYQDYLKRVDLEILYKYMPVSIVGKNKIEPDFNLVSGVKQIFGIEDSFDVMLIYGKYIEATFNTTLLKGFKFDPNYTKEELLDEMDFNILQAIIYGKIKYDEKISSHFKNNNPTLFLSESVPEDIRNKFYNREFTLKDFASNPNLLDIFGNTNIVCAFSEDLSWMIPIFENSENLKTANYNRLKIISEYSKINDEQLQDAFKEYVMEFYNKINMENIEYITKVLSRLSLSNSSEIFTFRKEIALQLLKSANPLESLDKLENVFLKNSIPVVGKRYYCFEILHPDFEDFKLYYSNLSPILKKSSTMGKKAIIFSDLIKSAFGSNNRSVNTYLQNIEAGSKLYESIRSGQIKYDSLDKAQKTELVTFDKYLATLYNNTMKSKNEKDTFTITEDVLADILELSKKLSPDKTLDYSLADRIIKMFCGFAGFYTLDQVKSYMNQKIRMADARNRKASSQKITLEKGDFVKGIGGINYLRNILQNGSISKEYLGSNAESDATPLDTDVSMITKQEGTNFYKISNTAAIYYGPIFFVLKNDDRFITTRTRRDFFVAKNDIEKMEVFYTGMLGEDHYGIRTGFASSEINYIFVHEYDPRIGLEIAMNGFYIPVVNMQDEIVFTPNDYDKLREKMSGLSYYNENNYIFSENLVTEETDYFALQIEENSKKVQVKRKKINEAIKSSLEELGLNLKTHIDGNLTEGFAELIDTGSTGRNTNMPGDGDFDFVMRLDKTLLSNSKRMERLRETLLKKIGKENSNELTDAGDFRLKKAQIDNDLIVDIDITFTPKTDEVLYSTDMALQDRLTTIQKIDKEKYKYVIANILLAKQVLKQAEAYKPNRGEKPQGGLGGVGIENWILQNGGSFIDAATSFIEASNEKSFEEFKNNYKIWNFGDNYLAVRRGQYPHDNYVASNMSESGYYKMQDALKKYLNSKGNTQIVSKSTKR